MSDWPGTTPRPEPVRPLFGGEPTRDEWERMPAFDDPEHLPPPESPLAGCLAACGFFSAVALLSTGAVVGVVTVVRRVLARL